MKIIYIEPEKCLGCNSCELACALIHSKSRELEKAIMEKPRPVNRVRVICDTGISMPLQCRHCTDAPCVKVCPSNALSKMENGIVLINNELCIGCKFCVIACPFGSIKSDKEGKAVVKCDLCFERIESGEDPACVTACATNALKYIDADDISKTKEREFLTEYSRKKKND